MQRANAKMSEEQAIAAKIGELGEQIKVAKAEKKPKEEWEPILNEMLALKVSYEQEETASWNIVQIGTGLGPPFDCDMCDWNVRGHYDSFLSHELAWNYLSIAHALPYYGTTKTTGQVQGGSWQGLRSTSQGKEREEATPAGAGNECQERREECCQGKHIPLRLFIVFLHKHTRYDIFLRYTSTRCILLTTPLSLL
jgi:hypothetical protein